MLEIALFSYNRGEYLRNCLESVRRNIPDATIRVYDDGSDDPATVAYLESLGDMVTCPKDRRSDVLGGLYGNMQVALEEAQGDLILMLQDDTQVVRRVDPAEIEAIRRWFHDNPKAAFVSPVFLKGVHRASRTRLMKPVEGIRGYHYDDSDPRRVGDMYYNDISFVNVARLREKGWVYKSPEKANAPTARDAGFSRQLVMADPFVFFCPEVPFFRKRERTLAARLADRVLGREVRRFIDMSEDERSAFISRPISVLPFAEDFLKTERDDVRRPFVYKSVNARWYTRILNKLELAFRR